MSGFGTPAEEVVSATSLIQSSASTPEGIAPPEEGQPPARNANLRWNLGRYQLFHNLYFGDIHNPPLGTMHPDPRVGPLEHGTYLLKHPRESATDFEQRRRAAFTIPYPRDIIRKFVDALFHQPVDRSRIEGLMPEGHLSNVDGQGHSARWWLRNRMCTQSQIYGGVGVLSDMPPAVDGMPNTRYHNDTRPYARVVSPLRIWDWYRDPSTGAYIWALIQESSKRWALWTCESVSIIDEHGKTLERRSHGFGCVPLDVCVAEPCESDDDRSPLGVSALDGIERLALHLYQMCSLLEAHERKALFAFLHLQRDPPGKSEKAQATDLHLSESHFLFQRENVGWVEPPESVPREGRAQIEWTISQMRQVVGLSIHGEESQEARSGVSLSWQYSDRRMAVTRRGEELEEAESRLWQRHGDMLGISIPPGLVVYPRDYAVAVIPEELAEIKAVIEPFGSWAASPPEIQRYVWLKYRRIVARDEGYTEDGVDVLEAIDGEIEELKKQAEADDARELEPGSNPTNLQPPPSPNADQNLAPTVAPREPGAASDV